MKKKTEELLNLAFVSQLRTHDEMEDDNKDKGEAANIAWQIKMIILKNEGNPPEDWEDIANYERKLNNINV